MLLANQGGIEGFHISWPMLLLFMTASTSADRRDHWPSYDDVRINSNGLVEATLDDALDVWYPLHATSRTDVSFVVCRQLGMGPPLIHRYTFVEGFTNFSVQCSGSESSLSSCQRQSTTVGYYQIEIEECLPLENVEKFDVALSRTEYHELHGIPLVYLDGHWSSFCLSSTFENAVCRQLDLGDQDRRESQHGDEFTTKVHFECTPEDEFLEECNFIGYCNPGNVYWEVTCLGYIKDTETDDDGSGFRFPYFYGVGFVTFFIVMYAIMRNQALKNRRNTNRNATSVSQTVAHPTTHSTAAYPRQMSAEEPLGPSPFDSTPPPYPGVSPSAPPPSDPHLPSYEQAVSQGQTQY